MKAIFMLALALASTGCASAVRGTTEQVVITAEPDDAAIRTTSGQSCPRSPCSFEISRKTEFTAFAEKEGFKPGQIYVATKVSGNGAAGMAGNILLGGVIGAGVDVATGATLDHYPNPAHIVLVPVDSEAESTNIPKPKEQVAPEVAAGV